MTTVKPKLLYFDSTFWKGEVPRICYFYAGIPFEDKRVNQDEFKVMKEKDELPFGQLPVLVLGEKKLTQGCAIIRFVGKQSGLLPSDSFESARVDEVLHLMEEFMGAVTPAMREQDDEKKKVQRKAIADNEIPLLYSRFEKLLNKNVFFVGGKLSVADLSAWKLIQWLESGKLDYVPTGILSKYPVLEKNYKAVDSDEKVVAWKKANPGKY